MRDLYPLLCIWLFLMLCIYDDVVLDNKYSNKIIYGKNCKFIIPDNYEIRNTDKGYVVARDYWYLGNIGPVRIIEGLIPAYFSDTCSAKAFLEAYLKQGYE